MKAVLVARAGFRDETAIVRLHHDAGLTARTHPGDLRDLVVGGVACCAEAAGIAFACPGADDPRHPGVLNALGELRADLPHVVLTAFLGGMQLHDKGRSRTTVALFDAGADEVVPEWIDAREYAARFNALLRRREWNTPAGDGGRVSFGGRPRLDLSRRQLVGSRGCAELTAKECVVMRALMQAPDVATRAHLAEQLWTDGWFGTTKAIDMHIANVRRKLRRVCGGEWSIQTVRGAGFILVSEAVKVAG